MKAKEFLKNKNIVGKVDRAYIEKWCEEYHQAKSKEEAEDFKILRQPPDGFRIDYMASPYLPTTRGVLMLHPDLIPKPSAAFGKLDKE